jgi:hypothetical protein
MELRVFNRILLKNLSATVSIMRRDSSVYIVTGNSKARVRFEVREKFFASHHLNRGPDAHSAHSSMIQRDHYSEIQRLRDQIDC